MSEEGERASRTSTGESGQREREGGSSSENRGDVRGIMLSLPTTRGPGEEGGMMMKKMTAPKDDFILSQNGYDTLPLFSSLLK